MDTEGSVADVDVALLVSFKELEISGFGEAGGLSKVVEGDSVGIFCDRIVDRV